MLHICFFNRSQTKMFYLVCAAWLNLSSAWDLQLSQVMGEGLGFFNIGWKILIQINKDVFFLHLTMLLMKMCYLYFSILKHYFYYAHRSTVNSIKLSAATILGYDNQHISETKIFFFFFAIENSIQEVICSFVG